MTLVNATTGEGTCHHVMIWAEEDGWTASLHCSLSPELSIDEAHQLSERLEARLREEIPHLHRVVIHLEPPQ